MSIEFTPQRREFDEHPDELLLDQYVLGRVDEATSAFVEKHLLVCVICRERAEWSEAFVRAFRAASERLAGG